MSSQNSIQLNTDLKQRAKIAAKNLGISLEVFFNDALKHYLSCIKKEKEFTFNWDNNVGEVDEKTDKTGYTTLIDFGEEGMPVEDFIKEFEKFNKNEQNAKIYSKTKS